MWRIVHPRCLICNSRCSCQDAFFEFYNFESFSIFYPVYRNRIWIVKIAFDQRCYSNAFYHCALASFDVLSCSALEATIASPVACRWLDIDISLTADSFLPSFNANPTRDPFQLGMLLVVTGDATHFLTNKFTSGNGVIQSNIGRFSSIEAEAKERIGRASVIAFNRESSVLDRELEYSNGIINPFFNSYKIMRNASSEGNVLELPATSNFKVV